MDKIRAAFCTKSISWIWYWKWMAVLTIRRLELPKEAGANVFVAGSYIFKGDVNHQVQTLQDALHDQIWFTGRIWSICLDFDVLVGVDRGSLFLLEQGVCLTWLSRRFWLCEQGRIVAITDRSQGSRSGPSWKGWYRPKLAVLACFERYPDPRLAIFGAFGAVWIMPYCLPAQ